MYTEEETTEITNNSPHGGMNGEIPMTVKDKDPFPAYFRKYICHKIEGAREDAERDNNQAQWQKLARVLDRLFFWLYLTIVVYYLLWTVVEISAREQGVHTEKHEYLG